MNRLEITDLNQLMPILYYLNPTKRWGPIYVPSSNVMRGPQLFDQFFETRYEDVDKYLNEIGEDEEVMTTFDNLYRRIRSGG